MQKAVFIVGAGVIGLTLAKELALKDIDVTVYDSKSKVSDNAAKASGIFSREGLAKMDMKWETAQQNTLDGAVIHAGGEQLKVSSTGTVAYVLDRGIFANLCAKEAVAAGAKLAMGRRLEREQLIEIGKDNEKILVGADGAVSNVASALGFQKIEEYILTYKAEYEGVDIPDEHKVEVMFSNKIASRFFGWTCPYSGSKLEVGIGISDRSRSNSTGAFNKFIQTDYMKKLLAGAERTAGYASIIPIKYRSKTVIGNTLLVGDAAGQVKATTGGGIIFGSACAKVAARCISENIKHGRPLMDYEKAWRKDHQLDLRLHKAIHGYYSMLGDDSFAAMIKLLKLAGFEGFLGRYGDMDRPSLVLKRFFLRGAAK